MSILYDPASAHDGLNCRCAVIPKGNEATRADVPARLVELLGIERAEQLVLLLQDVLDDTGFGDVKLVVAEGKVTLLKAEKSYK